MEKIQFALGFELGKKYICSYWMKRHEIIDIKYSEGFGEIITSLWEDGNITNHFTSRNKYDFEITEQCEPCENRNAHLYCSRCKSRTY